MSILEGRLQILQENEWGSFGGNYYKFRILAEILRTFQNGSFWYYSSNDDQRDSHAIDGGDEDVEVTVAPRFSPDHRPKHAEPTDPQGGQLRTCGNDRCRNHGISNMLNHLLSVKDGPVHEGDATLRRQGLAPLPEAICWTML